MDLREGSCKRQDFTMTDILARPSHALNWHLLAKAREEGSQGSPEQLWILQRVCGEPPAWVRSCWLQTDKAGPAKAPQVQLCTLWQLTGL